MYNQFAYEMGSNGSVIRDLHEYACQQAAIVGAENVYDFTVGNPSIPTPKKVDQTVRDILQDTDSLEIHSYTSAIGDYAARKAIADDLNSRYDAGVRPENLFLSCGTSPALAATFRALTFPGAEILTIAPYFPEYKPFVEGAGAELKVVPPDVPNFQIHLNAVEDMLTEKTAAVIINSPCNPSGVVYTRETLTALAELLTRKGEEFGHPIYIVSDDPYRELVYGGVEAPFIPNIYPNTIVCYSYSKSLSLPGERIGYVYVPDQAQDSAALYAAVAGASRAIGHICAPSLWQKVMIRCAHLRPDLEAYDKNRLALYNGLTAMGYEAAKPDGAFYLFVKAPGKDAEVFYEKAKQKNLLVVPGDSFGCPGYFRACYCVSHELILKSLPVFEALIRECE